MHNKQIDLYFLRCLTNTHPGSGDITYGVVDKQVQRDTITDLPTIHASGIKGAFREWLAYLKDTDLPERGQKHPAVTSIFGNTKDLEANSVNGNKPKLTSGSHIFFDAHLLALPVRANRLPFFRATSKHLLNQFLENIELFMGISTRSAVGEKIEELLDIDVNQGSPVIFIDMGINHPVRIEGWQSTYYDLDVNTMQELLGERIALLHHDDLKYLCGELPVIARNNIENGISQNLWYEEVVPRQTLFYSFLAYSSQENHILWNELTDQNPKEKLLLQVGGNATVGYGLCELQRFIPENKAETQKEPA